MKNLILTLMVLLVLLSIGMSFSSFAEPGIPPKMGCRLEGELGRPYAVVNSHNMAACLADDVLTNEIWCEHIGGTNCSSKSSKNNTKKTVVSKTKGGGSLRVIHNVNDCVFGDPFS